MKELKRGRDRVVKLCAERPQFTRATPQPRSSVDVETSFRDSSPKIRGISAAFSQPRKCATRTIPVFHHSTTQPRPRNPARLRSKLGALSYSPIYAAANEGPKWITKKAPLTTQKSKTSEPAPHLPNIYNKPIKVPRPGPSLVSSTHPPTITSSLLPTILLPGLSQTRKRIVDWISSTP